jgi:hypothetical protein
VKGSGVPGFRSSGVRFRGSGVPKFGFLGVQNLGTEHRNLGTELRNLGTPEPRNRAGL